MRVTIDAAGMEQAGFETRMRTWLLTGSMIFVLCMCAWLLAGFAGVVGGLVGLALAHLFINRLGPTAVMRLYRGVPLEPRRAPEIAGMVAELAQSAGLPRLPRLYWIPARDVNAFAVGVPNDAAIGISDAAFRVLSPREMRAVIAHEIAHLAANDLKLLAWAEMIGRMTRVVAFLALLVSTGMVISGADVPLGTLILFMIASPIIVVLQLALSRTREYAADLGAVQLTHDPVGLSEALQQVDRINHRTVLWQMGIGVGLLPPTWLRTHPPTEERVKRLLAHVRVTPVAWNFPLWRSAFAPAPVRPFGARW